MTSRARECRRVWTNAPWILVMCLVHRTASEFRPRDNADQGLGEETTLGSLPVSLRPQHDCNDTVGLRAQRFLPVHGQSAERAEMIMFQMSAPRCQIEASTVR